MKKVSNTRTNKVTAIGRGEGREESGRERRRVGKAWGHPKNAISWQLADSSLPRRQHESGSDAALISNALPCHRWPSTEMDSTPVFAFPSLSFVFADYRLPFLSLFSIFSLSRIYLQCPPS